MATRRTASRGKGEGTVFYEAKRKRWVAGFDLPRGADGARRRHREFGRTKAEALAKKKDAERRFGRLGDIPTAMTYGEWMTYWLDHIVKPRVRESTWRHYESIYRRHLAGPLSHVPLKKLTVMHVRAAVTRLDDRPAVAAKAYTIITMSLKAAVRQGQIEANPAERMDKPKHKAAELEYLTVEEMRQVMKHVTDSQHPLAALWLTYLFTGARRGELLGLEWVDVHADYIDLSWQLSAVPASSTIPKHQVAQHVDGNLWRMAPKTATGQRLVPIVEPVKSILALHREQTGGVGFVFTRNGRPVTPTYASKEWKHVLAAAGIEKNVRLHDIRHSTVTMLLNAGLDPATVAEMVGHSTRTQTLDYRNRSQMTRLVAELSRGTAELTT